MKKIFMLLCICIFMMTTLAYAKTPSPYRPITYVYRDSDQPPMVDGYTLIPNKNRPNVAVMYINNALTKFDETIDIIVLGNLARHIHPKYYNYVDGSRYIQKLRKMGIEDIATVERDEIVRCFKDEDIDYVVFVQIEPFFRKKKWHTFNQGVEMTTQAPFKIIDVVNNKYLYTAKFAVQGDRSTSWPYPLFDLTNKGSAREALYKVNGRINLALETRLPKTKPVRY